MLYHPNNARWLPVHLLNMVILQDNAPEVKKKFRMDDCVREES